MSQCKKKILPAIGVRIVVQTSKTFDDSFRIDKAEAVDDGSYKGIVDKDYGEKKYWKKKKEYPFPRSCPSPMV